MDRASQPPSVQQVAAVSQTIKSLQTTLMIVLMASNSLFAGHTEQPLPLNKITLLACIIYDLAHDRHGAYTLYKILQEQPSLEHESAPAAQELWSKIKKYYDAIKVGGTLLIFAAACYLLYQLYYLIWWLNVPCQSSCGLFIEKALPEKECAVDYLQQPVKCTLPRQDDVPQLPQVESRPEPQNLLPVKQQEIQLHEAKQQPEVKGLSSDTTKTIKSLFDYELCEKVANQIEHMKNRGMEAAVVEWNVNFAQQNLEQKENRKFNELIAAQVEHIKKIGLGTN